MRGPILALAATAIAACTTAPPQPVARTAEAEAELQALLAGKAAGAPLSCLPAWRSGNMVVIDDATVVFRDSANRVYVNNFRDGCPNLGSGWYALLTRHTGTSLCSGEIAQVLDTSSGMTVGSCVLGEFVPYTRAG